MCVMVSMLVTILVMCAGLSDIECAICMIVRTVFLVTAVLTGLLYVSLLT